MYQQTKVDRLHRRILANQKRREAQFLTPKCGTQRFLVLAFIVAQGKRGATDEEIQMGTGLNPNTLRPRRVELYKGQHIVKQLAYTRRARSGRRATVWVAKSCMDVGNVSYCFSGGRSCV